MPSYTISVLELDISFKTDADHVRVKAAKQIIEERFASLAAKGQNLSKEKLLTYLALGLADDFLLTCTKLGQLETKLEELLHRIEQGDNSGNASSVAD
ncbi:MAG TPA: cell division protein ZapA [Desulfonatronum sp.]|nr:cell division protein ZapA [Desulfonatronum sp.]